MNSNSPAALRQRQPRDFVHLKSSERKSLPINQSFARGVVREAEAGGRFRTCFRGPSRATTSAGRAALNWFRNNDENSTRHRPLVFMSTCGPRPQHFSAHPPGCGSTAHKNTAAPAAPQTPAGAAVAGGSLVGVGAPSPLCFPGAMPTSPHLTRALCSTRSWIAHPLLTAAAAEAASQMSSISGTDVTSMNSLLAREYLVCHNRPRALSQKSSVKQQSDTKHGLNPPRPRDVGDKNTW